jgi:hypothetical protein
MLAWQVPPSTILVGAQSVAGRDMPLEHLAAPAAFQANDIIAVNRSTDRHSRCSPSIDFGCRFTKADERLMNGRDQRREFVGSDLVPPNIGRGDFRSEFSIN